MPKPAATRGACHPPSRSRRGTGHDYDAGVRLGYASAMTIGLGLLLGACGGNDEGGAGGTPASVAAKRPVLRVARPREGTRTKRAAVTVSGTAVGAVQVTVGGRPATLRPGPGDRRLFSARVRLRIGTNKIVVVARSGATTAAETVRVVRVRRPRSGSAPATATGPPAGGDTGAPGPPSPGAGSGSPQGGPSAPSPSQGGPSAPSSPQGGPPSQGGAPGQGGPPAQIAPPSQGGPPSQDGG
jgi:hypothetical protein